MYKFTIKKYQANIDADSAHYEYSSIYHGDTLIGNFLFCHLFAILSFFIPFFIFLFLVSKHNFAPYGEYSFFHMDQITDSLGVLYSFITDIRSGNFSLLSEPYNGMDNAQSLIYYLMDPLKFLACIFHADSAISYLSIILGFQIGLCGLSSYIYFTQSPHSSHSQYDPLPLLFSLSYSLSSCVIVQSMQFEYMWAMVLFPVLFLSYEFYNTANNKTLYSVILSLILFLQFYIGLCLIPILAIHLLIFNSSPMKQRTRAALGFIKLSGLACLISGITVVPGITMLNYRLPDYSTILKKTEPLLGLYSRFFIGNDASYYYTFHNGTNVFCGTLILLLGIAGVFFLPESINSKIKKILFALILLLLANNQFLYSLGTLCREYDFVFHPMCFTFVFFLIVSASDSIERFRSLSSLSLVTALILPGILFLISLRFSDYFTDSSSMILSLCMIVVSCITLYLFWSGSIRRRSFVILAILISVFELAFESNYILYYSELDSLIFSEQITLTVSKQRPDYYHPFESIISKYSDTPQETFDLPLPNVCMMPNSGKTIYTDAEYLSNVSNPFEELNNRAFILGADNTLFSEFSSPITINTNSDFLTATDSHDGTITLTTHSSEKNTDYFVEFAVTEHPKGIVYLQLGDLYCLGELNENEKCRKILYFNQEDFHENRITIPYSLAVLDDNTFSQLKKVLNTDICQKNVSTISTNILEIKAPNDGLLLLPYKTKTHVNISMDGAKADTQESLDDRIAIPITKGTHQITISRDNTTLIIGVIISLSSWFLLMYHLFFHMKKDKKETI